MDLAPIVLDLAFGAIESISTRSLSGR